MDKLTIKETATALDVSMQTIRRRIAKGEIPAHKELTEYGETWYIPKSFINKAIQTVQVVPLNKNVTSEQLQKIINDAVSKSVTELTESIKNVEAAADEAREEVRQLRAELEAHNRRVDEQLRLSVTPASTPPPAKKGLWSKIFG